MKQWEWFLFNLLGLLLIYIGTVCTPADIPLKDFDTYQMSASALWLAGALMMSYSLSKKIQ